MKTFAQLTEKEKLKARQYHMSRLYSAIAEGALRFDDLKNNDDLQARIDSALAGAEKNHTPWFAHEYLAEDPVIRSAVEGMAECDAEDSLYSEPGDLSVIDGIVGEK